MTSTLIDPGHDADGAPRVHLLQAAVALHRAGRWSEAQQGYESVIAAAPEMADAHHLKAEVLHRQNQTLLALDSVNRAISLKPHPVYLNTRATIFLQMNLLAEALQDLRRAIKIVPAYAEAFINLSAVYRQQKRFKQAREASATAIQMAPLAPAAWNNAGAVHMELLQFDEAIADFRQALRLDANFLPSRRNIAKIFLHLQNWPDAVQALEQQMGEPPDCEMLFLLARALQSSGRANEAVAPMQRAMRNASLAERLRALNDPEGIASLCAVCATLEGVSTRHEESSELYLLALAVLPEHPLLLNNMGTAAFRSGRFEHAIEAHQKVLSLYPQLVLARCNLGVALVMTGRTQEAIREFEQCLRDDPGCAAAMVWLLGEKSHIADWGGMSELREAVAKQLDDPACAQSVSSFVLLSNFCDADRLKRWTSRSAAVKERAAGCLPFNVSGTARTSERIRIGYFSFDFRNHPVAHLTAELYGLHDRDAFEVFVYSYGPDDGHPIRKRISGSVENFVDLRDLSIQDMAERIRDDRIDILVDLTGDTRGGRPQVMAYRAAPVQVSWLGYMGTSGSGDYDYVVTDPFMTPPGFDRFYTEKLLRLPETFQVIDTQRQASSAPASRAAHQLPEDAFVFCNFSQSFKIQPEVFSAWVAIVRGVPDAVLWLAQGPAGFESNLRARWSSAGLSQERLIVAPRIPIDDHLARIALADLFLDTCPYGSGATANDVLWSGVPVLTCPASTMVSRMAGSLMSALGLHEFVVRDMAHYAERAIHYGRCREALDTPRAAIRAAKAQRQGYFDTPRFVRHLEDGFHAIAARSRAGLSVAHMDVAARARTS